MTHYQTIFLANFGRSPSWTITRRNRGRKFDWVAPWFWWGAWKDWVCDLCHWYSWIPVLFQGLFRAYLSFLALWNAPVLCLDWESAHAFGRIWLLSLTPICTSQVRIRPDVHFRIPLGDIRGHDASRIHVVVSLGWRCEIANNKTALLS